MTKNHERFRRPVVLGAATVLAIGGTACGSQERPDAPKLPGCESTEASRRDSQTLRPELASAVQQSLDIYKAQTKDAVMPYSEKRELYADLLRVNVPDQNKEIDVQVVSKRSHPTMNSLVELSTSIIDTTKPDHPWYTTQSVQHTKDGWRMSSSYLTKYTNTEKDIQSRFVHLEAGSGSFACAYQTESTSHSFDGTSGSMERYPADAHKIANEAIGRLTVLTGTTQHLTPGAIEYAMPHVSDELWQATDTPIPDAIIRTIQ